MEFDNTCYSVTFREITMSFPTDSEGKNLFRSHFRAASPILKVEEPDLIMESHEDVHVDCVREMTSASKFIT